jgi:predicted phosphodiesterase
MRIAIFSDVHGNLTALQAVLQDIQSQENIDEVLFAGDLCLLGPRPAESLRLVRQNNIACVYGNTDEWIHQPPPLSDDLTEEVRARRQRTRTLSEWTQAQLSVDEMTWLQAMPFHRTISPSVNPRDDLLIVHANPHDVNRMIYPAEPLQRQYFNEVRQTDTDLGQLLEGLIFGVLAFGHLHIPNVRHWGNVILANISSVSLPVDSDPRAKYGLLTWAEGSGWSVEHRYIAYPIEAELEAYKQRRPPNADHAIAEIEKNGAFFMRLS